MLTTACCFSTRVRIIFSVWLISGIYSTLRCQCHCPVGRDYVYSALRSSTAAQSWQVRPVCPVRLESVPLAERSTSRSLYVPHRRPLQVGSACTSTTERVEINALPDTISVILEADIPWESCTSPNG